MVLSNKLVYFHRQSPKFLPFFVGFLSLYLHRYFIIHLFHNFNSLTMKTYHTFFTFLCLLFYVHSFSQLWTPISEEDTYHYEWVGDTLGYDSTNTFNGQYFKNNNPVATSIWFDSLTVSNASQNVYYLNKIITPCNDTCPTPPDGWAYHLKNQPQFLQHQMRVFTQPEKYVFEGEDKWVLLPTMPLNSTWVFDTLNNINAEVVEVSETEIFGNTDSLKVIALSNGGSIVLSKDHGIIEFPDFESSNYYRLVGIQTRDLGYKIPGFKEIYNFDVGDVFQYNYQVSGIQGGYYGKVKIHVTNKQETADSVTYGIRRITYKIDSYYGNQSDTREEEIDTHTFYKGDMADMYPNQLFGIEKTCEVTHNGNQYIYINDYWDESRAGCFEYSANQTEFIGGEFFRSYYGQNQDDKWMKFMFAVPGGQGHSLVSAFRTQGTPSPDILINGVCPDIYFRTWEEGLGETTFNFMCHEFYFYRHLEGYVKDGDTTGIITPDSTLLTSNEAVIPTENLQVTLYPNPVNDQLHINIQSPAAIPEFDITIYNVMGKSLITKHLKITTSNTINVEALPSGIYLMTFKTKESTFTRKFVVH